MTMQSEVGDYRTMESVVDLGVVPSTESDAFAMMSAVTGTMGSGANDYGTGYFHDGYADTGRVTAHNQSEAATGWWAEQDHGQAVDHSIGGQQSLTDWLPYSEGPVNSEQQENFALSGRRVKVVHQIDTRKGPVRGGQSDLISQTAQAIASTNVTPPSNDDVAMAFIMAQGMTY